MSDLRKKIEHVINECSAENGSDTPDFILSEFLTNCLWSFDRALQAREKWYGRPIPDRAKPTIEELEAILNDPNAPPVYINPDGSISA